MALLNGANPDSVEILPSGFAIMPNVAATTGAGGSYDTNTDGTLVTIALQKVVHLGRNLKNFNKPLTEAKKRIRTIIAGVTRAALKDHQQFAGLY